ncbi:MAG: hypothetical protein WA001_01460 [Patescibacteria group bacterium]
MTDKIYYFPMDADGNETGKAILIDLNQDGSANVSRLPEELRERLETFGVPDALHQTLLLPKDGSRFLDALLRTANGYTRFRSTDKTPTV